MRRKQTSSDRLERRPEPPAPETAMLRASGYAARPSEDDDGCTAWRRVIEAISEFWRAKPAEGERVN